MTTVKDFLQVCINTKALKLLTEFKVTHHGGIKNFKKWGGGTVEMGELLPSALYA